MIFGNERVKSSPIKGKLILKMTFIGTYYIIRDELKRLVKVVRK